MILIRYLHLHAISYEYFRIDSLVYFMCVAVVSLLGYGEKRYCMHRPLNLVPPITQYLPLRNGSPEYEWDILLPNRIA